MLPSNQAWFAFSKQTAKGSPVAAPTWKAPYAGGTRVKGRNDTDQFNETDASRDEGATYKKLGGAEGAPEALYRDSYGHILLEAALGAKADVGTTNIVSTITPASALSYYTIDQMIGGALFERTEDAVVSDIVIKSDAGNPLTVTATVLGRIQKQLAADPAVGVQLASDQPYTYNDATVTLSSGATALVRAFELNYNNGASLLQTDDFTPLDINVGKRSVSVAYDLYFADTNEYNKFYYGSATPTLPATQSSTVYTTDLAFDFSHGVNNGLTLTLPRITVEEMPIDPNPGGDPIVISVRARAVRGGTPVLTAVAKHQ